MLRKNYYEHKLILFLVDTVLIFVSFYISLLLNNNRYSISENFGYIIAIYLITIIFFLFFDFYKYKTFILVKRYIINNILINIIVFGLITLFIFITPYGGKGAFINIFKYYFLVFFISFIVVRILMLDKIFKGFYKIGLWNKNVAVLGVNKESKLLFKNKKYLMENNGLNIIGFIKLNKNSSSNKRILGNINNILILSKKYNFKEIIIPGNGLVINELINKIEYLKNKGFIIHINDKKLNVLLDYGLYDIYGDESKFIDFGISKLFYRKFVKNFFNYLFTFLVLLVIFPIFIVIAILIKCTSRGDIFFTQERVGVNKKIFNIFKFRTIKSGKAINLKLNKHKTEAFYLGKKSGNFKKFDKSPMITKVGKFLRKYSLDELPQLLNVLKGDMNLIGPRPCIVYQVKYFKYWKKHRFNIKPGITGLWQTTGRSEVNFNDMSLLDYYYYANDSVSLDMRILFNTFRVIIFGTGGY